MFPHGQTIARDRRATETDPNNPARTRPKATWAGAATTQLDDAWIGTPSIYGSNDAARSNTVADAALYCAATADLQPGDRVRCDGRIWTVQAVPMASASPFTGWNPPIEVPLKEVRDP